ncbi:MAG: class I SAM-dependent DNA methyltransferase [Verrucomicrobia bacterium]|nr:class I SAM-dependent DNA methyltransferase [Verrucomicrobiota bacterium]
MQKNAAKELTWDEMIANAVAFSKKWESAAKEKAQSQSFLRDFFEVFGVDALQVGAFEHDVPKEVDDDGFIDYFWKGKIAIEMKSRGKSLSAAYRQLKDYVIQLPSEEMPDLMMVCDFETAILYHRGKNKRKQFKIKELHKNIRQFSSIAGYETTREIEEQVEVNVKAAEKMAKLHDALKDHGYEGHDLEVYLVRLLFCLFADDTGIFPKQIFLNYLENSRVDGSDLSDRINRLFEILDLSDEARKKRTLLSHDLKQFRYINGSLFKQHLPTADFDAKMRQSLLDCCHFDWSKISPAIFGAMFQGVMDKKKRREMGAHYTSEENILKLINPLFMDELYEEFEHAKVDVRLLDRFHEKISNLKFLDPACGCGNFLIVTYGKLRELELKVLEMKIGGSQLQLDISSLLKVNVGQFYGIEYEDFPCQIAQVGMWLMDHLMNTRVAERFGMYYVRLPLTQSAKIVRNNALRIDWNGVVPKQELSYILGNPPFVGFSCMTPSQKADLALIFPKTKNLDYVTAWYMRSLNYIHNTNIKCAFVSTNSICQGEVVPVLWPKLFDKGLIINFARRTFVWSNEAKGKAAVHCIIIGFSLNKKDKQIIFENNNLYSAKNINPYLLDSSNIIVFPKRKPFYNVPKMVYGNKPADGGNLIIKEKEYFDFITKEPNSIKYIHRYYGAKEFLHKKIRYCLWLKNASPNDLKKLPLVLERIEKCKKKRENSKAAGIRKFGKTPTLFAQITQPDNQPYIIVPAHSSCTRKYIPLGFVQPDIISSNAVFIIPNAELYHFGVLMSSVHNAWMRVTCGRIKSDYRYSKEIVYNAFPWPSPTSDQKNSIEKAAQGVLDARGIFPDSSLAALYDPLTMPPELLKAHENLDRAVMKAYGTNWKTEDECVADLMQRYQALLDKQPKKKGI